MFSQLDIEVTEKIKVGDWVTISHFKYIKFILFCQRMMHSKNCKFTISTFINTHIVWSHKIHFKKRA
jgi:hypothetical protein